jgi:hypothetical protein
MQRLEEGKYLKKVKEKKNNQKKANSGKQI